MKSTSILRLFAALTTLFVGVKLSAQTDSAVWTNLTKPTASIPLPKGFPATAFDSAGYSFGSTIITANPYTYTAKLGIYKTVKPPSTDLHLPFGDTLNSMVQFAPTDTGTGTNILASAGLWEAGGSSGFQDRYIQFSLTASSNFTVTSVVAPIFSAGGSTGTGSYYYSTDGTNFTLLADGKAQAKIVPILKSDFSINTITVPDVVITAGETFYVRFVPFQNTTSTKAISKKGLGFERFAIYGNAGGVVPVKFSGINASLINKQSIINWNTGIETNVVNYSIERSINGFDFKEIGKTAATNSKNYSYTDQSPVSGINYYRIKSIDKSGALTYSSIVKVISQPKTGITIFPNPITNLKVNLQLEGVSAGKYAVNIYASNGQKVSSTSLNVVNSSIAQALTLPSSVKTGTYELELTNGATRVTKTISVQ